MTNISESGNASGTSQEIVSTYSFSASKFRKVDASEDRMRRYHDFLKNHRKSREKMSAFDLPDSGSVDTLRGIAEGKKKCEEWDFTTKDDYQKVKVLTRSIQLRPESILFLSETEGVTKNLLLYLIVMQEEGSLDFVWTHREIALFQEFALILTEKTPTKVAIEKALKSLKDLNAIKCLHRGHNILNPLVMTPKGTHLLGNLFNFVTRVMHKISQKNTGSKSFIKKHFLPKSKTVRTQAKGVSLVHEENRIAS